MKKHGLTLKEIEALTGGKLVGNPHHQIFSVAALEVAGESDAAFISQSDKFELVKETKAGVLLLPPDLKVHCNAIYHPTPAVAIEKVIEALHPNFCTLSAFQGIDPTAIIHKSVKLGKNVTIGPRCVIDQGTSIGDNTFLAAGCTVGPECTIGDNCILYPHVVIRERCTIANRVILQAGCVIGSCGFGYTQHQGKHLKQGQIGTVVIEDDVEIGANACIDRSRFKTTLISRGTKIDNLCNIGHGVTVGEDNILVAQCGIAGSTTTGRHVMFGGQVGVADHLSICDNVMVAAKSGISKSITKPGKYNGIPAMPIAEYNRMMVYLRKIESIVQQLKNSKEL
jgi:UDP-3-O-[3-hydroxymyristoyl] glucosamine N-acyltransferase